MARTHHISAVISLRDNMSATMRGIRREQRSFQRQVRQTRTEMRNLNRTRMTARLNATPAHRAIQSLRRRMAPLRQRLVTAVAIRDNTRERIQRVRSNLRSVGRLVTRPIVAIRDRTKSAINKIKGALKALKYPIAIGVGLTGAALKGGMELEQQKISMRHFMGVGNKGKSDKQISKMSEDYTKQLRENANATPFETGDVMAVGARSLQINNGNAKAAMSTVKLAEDMAA